MANTTRFGSDFVELVNATASQGQVLHGYSFYKDDPETLLQGNYYPTTASVHGGGDYTNAIPGRKYLICTATRTTSNNDYCQTYGLSNVVRYWSYTNGADNHACAVVGTATGTAIGLRDNGVTMNHIVVFLLPDV